MQPANYQYLAAVLAQTRTMDELIAGLGAGTIRTSPPPGPPLPWLQPRHPAAAKACEPLAQVAGVGEAAAAVDVGTSLATGTSVDLRHSSHSLPYVHRAVAATDDSRAEIPTRNEGETTKVAAVTADEHPPRRVAPFVHALLDGDDDTPMQPLDLDDDDDAATHTTAMDVDAAMPTVHVLVDATPVIDADMEGDPGPMVADPNLTATDAMDLDDKAAAAAPRARFQCRTCGELFTLRRNCVRHERGHARHIQ